MSSTPHARTGFLFLCHIVLSLAAFGQSVELDHGWSLYVDRTSSATITSLATAPAASWRPVRVGLSWNAQFQDLREYMGVAWYRTQIEVPQFESPRAVLLRFGAVDNVAEVFLNGRAVGTHEGGYTPFTLDISEMTRPGPNEVVVRVTDPPMQSTPGSKLPAYDEIPHGKQNWYVQTGGIWQPVGLEFHSLPYIKDVRVTAHNSGEVRLEVAVVGGEADATISLRSHAGGVVLERKFATSNGKADVQMSVPNPELWGPSNPALYTADVTLGNGEYRSTRFGFRSFEAREGKLFLNGEPFYMRAALDQDFYPETIYTPPSEAYVRDMMGKAKALGLNLLRCHIKVCDPQYLNAADETGMLVWYEVPSWNDRSEGKVFTPAAAERGERIFRAMFERDWNHPAIVIASIINESWGADLRNAEQRAWLKSAYGRAKTMVGDHALIVDNSACCNNFHVKSDLEDFHQYYSIPDNLELWDKWVANFASHPKWTFSQYGDAERKGSEPLIVSEFGNWGLPRLPEQLPWWFNRDFGGREVTRPAGVFQRFREYKFDRLFPGYSALAEATEWHQYRSLKHEIEQMRSHPTIQGYVITELTDINWEANGLMNMWRQPKVYAAKLAQIQQDNVLLLTPERCSYTSGDQMSIPVALSSLANADWNGARVTWSTASGLSGTLGLAEAKAATAVAPVGKIEVTAPEVNVPRIELLTAELISGSGQLLARNEVELYLFPRASGSPKGSMTVHDPSNVLDRLIGQLRDAGYKVGTGKLMLTSAWDGEVEAHLRSGGRALVLLNAKDAAGPSAPFKLVERAGSDYDGNWVTNFNWVLADAAPFKGVAVRPVLGFEAASVTPSLVIQGIAPQQYDRVLAGIFYGWLNNNAVLAVRVPVGSGEALVTTFRFDAYPGEPFARMLLDGMIASASSD
jgi:Fe-S cluster biosynthesis and repair protein YggX